MDEETRRLMEEGKAKQELVASEGWRLAKQSLNERLVALADITTITETDPVAILNEIGIRKQTIATVLGWVREIEGAASQHEANKDMFQQIKRESFVIIDS